MVARSDIAAAAILDYHRGVPDNSRFRLIRPVVIGDSLYIDLTCFKIVPEVKKTQRLAYAPFTNYFRPVASTLENVEVSSQESCRRLSTRLHI